jgi:hypothetical protein
MGNRVDRARYAYSPDGVRRLVAAGDDVPEGWVPEEDALDDDNGGLTRAEAEDEPKPKPERSVPKD